MTPPSQPPTLELKHGPPPETTKARLPSLTSIPTNDTMANHDASLELREHLESLPQELYDEIYKMTFSSPPGVVKVRHDSRTTSKFTVDLKPALNLMQVNRATRAQYSALHYNDHIYEFHHLFVCRDYLKAMPLWHRLLLRRIRTLEKFVPKRLAEGCLRSMCKGLGMSDNQVCIELIEIVSREANSSGFTVLMKCQKIGSF